MAAPSNTTFVNGTSQVSADNLNTFIQCCATVTTARGFIGAEGMEMYLKGFTATNDGGQGLFYWNDSSTATDDAGLTTIEPSGATTGRWIRMLPASGTFVSNGSVATTMTSLGPTGSRTTIQKWLKILDNTGNYYYIPCY